MATDIRRYIAVIGDLVGSKRLDRTQRTQIGTEIAALLSRWNKRPTVAAAFVVSRGDEFEGLLHNTEALPEILWELATELADIEVRLGIGVGEIFTPLPTNSSDEVDGPAYHRARQAIDAAGSTGHRGGDVIGFGSQWDEALGAIARALYAQRIGWTAAQRRVATLLRSGLEQSRIAEKLGVTRQNISKHASASGWVVHADLEKALTTLLELAWLEAQGRAR